MERVWSSTPKGASAERAHFPTKIAFLFSDYINDTAISLIIASCAQASQQKNESFISSPAEKRKKKTKGVRKKDEKKIHSKAVLWRICPAHWLRESKCALISSGFPASSSLSLLMCGCKMGWWAPLVIWFHISKHRARHRPFITLAAFCLVSLKERISWSSEFHLDFSR